MILHMTCSNLLMNMLSSCRIIYITSFVYKLQLAPVSPSTVLHPGRPATSRGSGGRRRPSSRVPVDVEGLVDETAVRTEVIEVQSARVAFVRQNDLVPRVQRIGGRR